MNKNISKILLIMVVFIFIGGFLILMHYNYSDEKNSKKDEEVIEKVNDDSIDEIEEYKDSDLDKEENIKSEETEKDSTSVNNNNDQYIVATGYAGASNNAYYTKHGNLYHLTISTNEVKKIAEGVEKIEEDLDTILVYKGKNFKLLINDSYLTFVD